MIAPILLAGLGFWLLAGCIYIPNLRGNVVSGKDPSALVGPNDSRKPLRVGVATRADIEKRLGPSNQKSYKDSLVGYSWNIEEGHWLWPLCFSAYEHTSTRTLWLTFDGDDRLSDLEYEKDSHSDMIRISAPSPRYMPAETTHPPTTTRENGR
jgi:hypothetical protein